MLPALTLTTAPATEPHTTAEILAFVKAEPEDAATVEALYGVAREFVEEQTGRALITQTWTLKRSCWPAACKPEKGKLYLQRVPTASVTSVKYWPADGGAQVTLSTSVYRAVLGFRDNPGFIELISGQSWPATADRSDAIEIVFTAGDAASADVKKTVKHAVLLLTKHLYDNGRDPVNIGNIVNDVPFTLTALLQSQRTGGWCA
jgi:uncharacterized phiE125 gp8 family phage protein